MVKTKINEERIFNVPLRKEVEKVPRWKRTKKAVTALREFISKHMKSDKVIIGKYLNSEIWKNGRKNPPLKLHVKAVKLEVEQKDKKKVEVVKVELVGAPEEKKEEQKKKGLFGKSKEKQEVKETKEEEKEKEEKEEEKKVLEHARLDKHATDVVGYDPKEYQIKSQKLKKSGIIGSTGKE